MSNLTNQSDDNDFEKFLENKHQIIITSLMWLFLTISDDIRYMYLPQKYDHFLDIFESAMLAFFILEMLLSLVQIKSQYNSFIFFVDMVSCLSVLPDIEQIWGQFEKKLTLDSIMNSDYNDIKVTEINGSAYNFVGNAFKIFRSAAQVAKLYRNWKQQQVHQTYLQHKMKSRGQGQRIDQREADDIELVKESRMSKNVTNRLNQNIFIQIVIPIFILEFLKIQLDPFNVQGQELNTITSHFEVMSKQESSDFSQQFQSLLERHGDIPDTSVTPDNLSPIMQFKADQELFQKLIPNNTQGFFLNSKLQNQYGDYRPAEIQVQKGDQNSILVVLVRQQYFLKSALNLTVNVFILFILSFAFYDFFSMISSVVLTPIEDMVRFVSQTIENPLKIDEVREDQEALKKIREEEIAKSSIDRYRNQNKSINLNKRQSETNKLENSIQKICNLLIIGVGEAGQDLISHNLKQTENSNQKSLQSHLRGKIIQAIQGFCDIRNFTTTTEILQERVLEQVNTIADVIHKNVDCFNGKPNKNIGDAFLIVWKFDSERIILKENNIQGNDQTSKVAEFALISTIKNIYDIFYDKKIHKLDLDVQALTQANNKEDKFETKLGFGLHSGEAQEGALGSEYKIDCTYLSSEVKTSETLESSTKEYGVNLLMSDKFVQLLKPSTQDHLRKVDYIQLNSHWQYIYTYDIMKDPNKHNEQVPVINSSPFNQGIKKMNQRSDNTDEQNETTLENYKLIKSQNLQQLSGFDSSNFTDAFEHWIVGRKLFGSPDNKHKLNLMKDQTNFKKAYETGLEELFFKKCPEKALEQFETAESIRSDGITKKMLLSFVNSLKNKAKSHIETKI